MKVLYSILAGTCLSLSAIAQVDAGATNENAAGKTDSAAPATKARPSKWFDYSKNVVKVNVSSIALGNYGIYYERMLTRKISATAGFRYMPNTKLTETPLGKQLIDLVDEEDRDDLRALGASNNTITAGVRFYTGKRAGAKGLYAEIYGRYGQFKLDYDYSFTASGKEYDMVIKGDAKGFGGGVLFGGQFMIAKRLVVDLYIVGAHYGKLTGTINGISDLSTMSAQDKQDMQNDINDIAPEINGKKLLVAEVSDTGVKGKLDGPFLGARGLGLSIGWSF